MKHPLKQGTSDADTSKTEVVAALRALGLVSMDESPVLEPLSGGVSSDVWHVGAQVGNLCVKRALPRLRVTALWEAPIARNHYEAEWLRVAGAIRPSNVPQLLGEDEERKLLVMRYLPPSDHRLWKSELREGGADPDFAREVGEVLVAIHGATAGDCAVARRFPTDMTFHALRLEPYLEATARVHGEVAGRLTNLSATTSVTRRALVHGDVSPKNILVGPNGPVILDAECAWYGDPAFDLAFALNHLLLKCIWRPTFTPRFLACFHALGDAYVSGVTWEDARALDTRVAALLPALLLARIDGKSPVEYITTEDDRDRIRRFAIPLLQEPVAFLNDIAERWPREIR